jgi:hypothetical protein
LPDPQKDQESLGYIGAVVGLLGGLIVTGVTIKYVRKKKVPSMEKKRTSSIESHHSSTDITPEISFQESKIHQNPLVSSRILVQSTDFTRITHQPMKSQQRTLRKSITLEHPAPILAHIQQLNQSVYKKNPFQQRQIRAEIKTFESV